MRLSDYQILRCIESWDIPTVCNAYGIECILVCHWDDVSLINISWCNIFFYWKHSWLIVMIVSAIKLLLRISIWIYGFLAHFGTINCLGCSKQISFVTITKMTNNSGSDSENLYCFPYNKWKISQTSMIQNTINTCWEMMHVSNSIQPLHSPKHLWNVLHKGTCPGYPGNFQEPLWRSSGPRKNFHVFMKVTMI